MRLICEKRSETVRHCRTVGGLALPQRVWYLDTLLLAFRGIGTSVVPLSFG